MYQNNRIKLPARTDKDYVIYFYKSGLSKQYQQRQKNIFTRLNYGPAASYDFSSDLSVRHPWPKPQTVEDVVQRGYLSIPKGEPETAIISDRKNTSWLGLDDLIGQIRNRYKVYENNLYELEKAKCATTNSLFEHRAYHGPTTSKVEYSAKKRLNNLYSEQREERVNLWRDISKLKLLLPEQAQNYLSAYRKVSILEDDKGDGP
ncbi:MAG: hypothetical protein ACYS32_17580 [Planctomycetota bacterium]|jgi:hypothetical protein